MICRTTASCDTAGTLFTRSANPEPIFPIARKGNPNRFLANFGHMYAEQYRRSLDDPDGFWGEAANAIDWVKEPTIVLDDSDAPFYRWFSDGELNTCPSPGLHG